ncbi:MAG TPA: hypothetical protein VEK77_14435 [Gemmatimonadales bacterium]|nr:hypothetical protein [Gemmatimonadales bacterium]
MPAPIFGPSWPRSPEQVKVLDGVVRYRFGDNAELMGAWASVHNVAGPFRSRTEPQVGGGETPKAA